MKVINSSVQEIKQAPGISGIYRHIERCGRTCYKSEDKITEDSAMKFFQRLVNMKHYAMLEHGTVYLKLPCRFTEWRELTLGKVINSKYSLINEVDGYLYVTTNMRVFVEAFPNDYDDIIIEYALEEPDANNIKRVTAHFVISRAIANEFVRHRLFSFAQESTRYCNYSKDKFGGELTFIRPEWLKSEGLWLNNLKAEDVWFNAMAISEDYYLDWINLGVKPQNARGVLPLDLKTELIMTGTLDQWEGFFDLRLREVTGPAHPDAKAIAKEWYNIIK